MGLFNKKNDAMFIDLIINNDFKCVNDDYCLINVNAYNFLILFDLMKFVIFNDHVYIINEML